MVGVSAINLSTIPGHPGTKRFDIQAYVRNLTKAYYLANGVESAMDVYVPGAPRTFGFNAGFHF